MAETCVLYPEAAADKLKSALLGHAAMYLEFPTPPQASPGIRILTDPVFSVRCSPTQWFGGPKRILPPPCQVPELPDIDLVLLSHNHYDHLDSETISALIKRFPTLHFVVPIGGVIDLVASFGVARSQIHEMDWWNETWFTKSLPSISDASHEVEAKVRLGYLPAQHFTGRGLTDQASTLWGSYSIESAGKTAFFAGDTGRRTVSQEIENGLKSDDESIKKTAAAALAELPHVLYTARLPNIEAHLIY